MYESYIFVFRSLFFYKNIHNLLCINFYKKTESIKWGNLGDTKAKLEEIVIW